jgi:uncharacterized protein (DUF2336 family)
MDTPSQLKELIALAHEPSSRRRRELLRRVTDIFLAEAPGRSAQEVTAFDGVFCSLADEVAADVRAELAARFADASSAPDALAARLARDCIEVALPILSNANLLSEEVLLDVARTRGQDHLRAVSARPGLSEAVSDVIVERGDDETLGVLVRNDAAALSRRASETVVERAQTSRELQQAVVNRASLPLDLLNEMYLVVESSLRERIRARNAAADPDALEAALKLARARLAARAQPKAPDLGDAEAEVARMAERGRLNPPALLAYLRSGQRGHFCAGLGHMAEVDAETVCTVVERSDFDAMAIVCKAADLDKSMFLTFAVLTYGGRDAMNRAAAYGKLYLELPRETAQRTLRFWRIRQQGDTEAVAA